MKGRIDLNKKVQKSTKIENETKDPPEHAPLGETPVLHRIPLVQEPGTLRR